MNKKNKINKKNINSFKTSEVVFLIVLTCAVSLLIGWGVSNKLNKNVNKIEKTKNKELDEFVENYNYILKNYYGEIDSKKLLDGATKGMLSNLGDEYSTVISDSDANNFNIRLEGSYEGIGVEIINDNDNNVMIYDIIENSPAAKAELKAGDIILKINDKDLTNTKTSELSEYVRNSDSETFNLIVKRDEKEINIKLKREKVVLKSVKSEIYSKGDKKIGYIYISIFANDTYKQFKTELEKLENKKIDSLIIDVRDNTGGHLTTVSKIISLFLDSKHVIYQTETKGNIKKYYSKGNQTKKYKIAVLQNENSASASELLSAALKEELNATIIGKKSYGKGTVQELITTSNGREYKITTKKWLTPKGNWINEKGVSPDVELDLSEEYKNNPNFENDNQLNKAIEELINNN